MSNRTISITEARKRIFDISSAVQTSGVHFTLTEKGSPSIVMLSAKEYESWVETLETLSDIPDIEKEIRDARKDLLSKKYFVLEDTKAKYTKTKHVKYAEYAKPVKLVAKLKPASKKSKK